MEFPTTLWHATLSRFNLEHGDRIKHLCVLHGGLCLASQQHRDHHLVRAIAKVTRPLSALPEFVSFDDDIRSQLEMFFYSFKDIVFPTAWDL
ncbi:hypothetical protein ROHU_032614 [Labeo rohita]|uniref:Uncharacterized protein n=1 Tax=Labeo rohita TaxID=84645 RepID=A0A498LFC0_LABRO|nr:hypothetical protein ROHU_032614 [Labeo rohita]